MVGDGGSAVCSADFTETLVKGAGGEALTGAARGGGWGGCGGGGGVGGGGWVGGGGGGNGGREASSPE